VALAGIGLAYYFNLLSRTAGDSLARTMRGPLNLFEKKYWIDEIYGTLIVSPVRLVAQVFNVIDRIVIDGLVVLVTGTQALAGFGLRQLTQRGYLQGYALTAILGTAVILWVVFYI